MIKKSFIIINIMFIMLMLTSCFKNKQEETITVHFDSNFNSIFDEDINLKKGSTINEQYIPNLNRQDYTFSGWYDEINLKYDFSIPFENNQTLVAKWVFKENGESKEEIKKVQVNFNYNYDNKKVVIFVKEGEITSSFLVERKGYIFMGWMSRQDLTGYFNFSQPIVQETNIYAKWRRNFDELIIDTDKNDSSNIGIINVPVETNVPIPASNTFITEQSQISLTSDSNLNGKMSYIPLGFSIKENVPSNISFYGNINIINTQTHQFFNDYNFNFNGKLTQDLSLSCSSSNLSSSIISTGHIDGVVSICENSIFPENNTFSKKAVLYISTNCVMTTKNNILYTSMFIKINIEVDGKSFYSYNFEDGLIIDVNGSISKGFEGQISGNSSGSDRTINFDAVTDTISGSSKGQLFTNVDKEKSSYSISKSHGKFAYVSVFS